MIGYGNSMFLATHGILARSASGGGIDPDAQAFITAAAITDPTQQAAINTLVVDLKGYNIWTKFKAIYPIVGGTAAAHKWNLKDPRDLDAAFRLTFANGWTHSSTGMTANGATYANTFLAPSTSLNINSTHLSSYSRTNVTATQNDMGSFDGGSGQCFLIFNFGSQRYIGIHNSGSLVGLLPNTTGLLIENRPASTGIKTFKNGSLFATTNITPSVLSSFPIWLGAGNNAGSIYTPSTKQYSFFSIGDGLSDTEAANYYTAVQAYQTTLGRQV